MGIAIPKKRTIFIIVVLFARIHLEQLIKIIIQVEISLCVLTNNQHNFREGWCTWFLCIRFRVFFMPLSPSQPYDESIHFVYYMSIEHGKCRIKEFDEKDMDLRFLGVAVRFYYGGLFFLFVNSIPLPLNWMKL